MKNPWDNLPNGKAIDLVLADVFKNPQIWEEMYNEMHNIPVVSDQRNSNCWNAVWIRSREKLKTMDRYDLWLDISERIVTPENGMSLEGAKICARSTILGLLSDDECGNLLDSDPEHIKLLTILGDDSIMMICPGCMSLNPNRVKRGIKSE